MQDPGVLYRIPDSGPPISRGRLAVLLWLVVESMFFMGLLGAFIVVRLGASEWPPSYRYNDVIYQPLRVDMAAPIVNAVVLTSAMVVAILAQRAARRNDRAGTRKLLGIVTALGVAFLAIMTYEFIHEAGKGLTLRSGSYGAYVFVISAAHGVHVLAGIIWQLIVLGPSLDLPAGGVNKDRVEYLGLYWGFVTFVWFVLLVLLYIL